MNSRVVGFDFGLKKIGLATGNSITRTSQALDGIPAVAGKPDWTRMLEVIREWQPGQLLVGLPLGMDGEDTPMSTRARRFAKTLETRSNLPVVLVDERYTSAAADSLLRESAMAGKSHNRQIAKHRDSVAAELIIQTYFNDNRGASIHTAGQSAKQS